jgi:Acetokinase family
MNPENRLSSSIYSLASPVRARICDGLEFLGIAIGPKRNLANQSLISTDAARVKVRVIPTDEENRHSAVRCSRPQAMPDFNKRNMEVQPLDTPA